MNNEPVAWMLTLPDGTHDWILDGNGCEGYIPLYTHPVKELDEQFKKGFEAGKKEGWKAHKFHYSVKEQDESFDRTASHMAGEYVSYTKELTDEEIRKIALDCDAYENDDNGGLITDDICIDKFARAILRKAQE